MRYIFTLIFLFIIILNTSAQSYLGIFEVGDQVPFVLLSSDPETGMPTNPINLEFSILRDGNTIDSGVMHQVDIGLATGIHPTNSDVPGNYNVLMTGLIGSVTTRVCNTYTLVPDGQGITSIGSEVEGLDGNTPLTESVYTDYHDEIVSTVHDSIADATNETLEDIEFTRLSLSEKIDAVTRETLIVSREISRARLWYAQDTIESPTRKVPADMPSHMEIQVAAPDDIGFATPVDTFYRVYFYPSSVTGTIPSREERLPSPPLDGIFYKTPDIAW